MKMRDRGSPHSPMRAASAFIAKSLREGIDAQNRLADDANAQRGGSPSEE